MKLCCYLVENKSIMKVDPPKMRGIINFIADIGLLFFLLSTIYEKRRGATGRTIIDGQEKKSISTGKNTGFEN